MNRSWILRMRLAFYAELIYEYFGGYYGWQVVKLCMLPDDYAELMADLTGAYCAGGEL